MATSDNNQALIAATGDAFKASRLERMLSNFAASYKFYWLKGVIDEVLAGNTVLPMRRIAARMVASAWYPVTYFRLNLGASDQLADAVKYAQQTCGLGADAKEREIIQVLLASPDQTLQRKLNNLCNMVPYRLIRPFYSDLFAQERQRMGQIPDRMVNRLVVEYNQQDVAGAPYRFMENVEREKCIQVQADWVQYFRDNRQVILGWLDMRLVSYLQARNPSVPAIPLKIYPPEQRDLAAARKYWTEALADHEFREIYSGIVFGADGYDRLGPMSVDHFIPWSFVLHDEPWNLVPMFRSTNSSKGNRLPDMERYLQPFCAQQFDALMTLRGTGRHKKMFESYVGIDPLVMEYERTPQAMESFTQAVSRVVVPLHQIALNQGFPTWLGLVG